MNKKNRSPKVIVTTVNFNLEEDTIKCVNSLLRQDYKNYEIVVVDNGSERESYERLRSKFKNIKFLRNEENLGFTGGYNTGIRYAKNAGARYVLIINNDTLADKNYISELVKVAVTDKKIGIVGCKALFMGERDKIQTAGILFDEKAVFYLDRGLGEKDNGQYDKAEEMIVSGVSMLINLSMPGELIYFDDSLKFYYEDVDICERVRRAGYKIMYNPKAVLEHRFSATANKVSGLKAYYGWRNHLRVIRKYHSFSTYLITLVKAWLRGVKFLFSFDKVLISNYFKALLTA